MLEGRSRGDFPASMLLYRDVHEDFPSDPLGECRGSAGNARRR